MHKNPSREEIKKILQGTSTVAVVGLSDNPYRTGPVLGEEPYATVEEIPERVDIVNVFRRSEKVVSTAEDAVAAGAKVLWMQSGVINEEAANYAEEHGLTVVMDRCIKVDYTTLVGASTSPST